MFFSFCSSTQTSTPTQKHLPSPLSLPSHISSDLPSIDNNIDPRPRTSLLSPSLSHILSSPRDSFTPAAPPFLLPSRSPLITPSHPFFQSTNLPSPPIPIKPSHLPPGLLHLLPCLHAHIEDRTIPTRANHLIVHTALTPLALGPQPPKAHL